MLMNKIFSSKYFLTYIFALLCTGFLFQSCHKDEPSPEQKHTDTSILLYAVASNNLSISFNEDLKEMKLGLKEVDLDRIDYYIYYVRNGLNPGPVLVKAVKNHEGEVDFQEIKAYDRETPSTDPKRISQIINEFSTMTSGDTKGLILWSHSTAWAPSPSFNPDLSEIPAFDGNNGGVGDGSKNDAEQEYNLEMMPQDIIKWWGQDIETGVAHYCELPDLANAIPDKHFDFIWFDCCYMSSIEVIYQLRNKANLFVAYPTEVLAEGAPYDLVLPLIAKINPDLVAAADAMSDYYLSGNKMFTVAVIDPAPIEAIAEMAQSAIPGTRAPKYKLIKYSRGGYGFYDFGQYTRKWGDSLNNNESGAVAWDTDEFNRLMNDFVIYKNCSNKIFTGSIDTEQYSGISCGYFDYNPDSPTAADASDYADQVYYTRLDWFDRVYKPFWPAMFQ